MPTLTLLDLGQKKPRGLSSPLRLVHFSILDQSADVALQQIKDKHSVDRFKTEGKPIHLVGVSFYPEDRNFSDWKEETICNDLGGK